MRATAHLLLTVAAFLLSSVPAAGETRLIAPLEDDVRYRSTVPLAAAFIKPDIAAPWPAAVIVQGSGASDRTNVWARAIAELFRDRGVAVLLTDKRGSGRSAGDWQSAGFEELADDAVAGVEYLRTREDVDKRLIGIVGLSQGAWVAPLAAVKHPHIAFIVIVSGATVGYAEQSMHEMANTARQAGLSDTAIREILDLNRAAGRYVLGGRWADYAFARERAVKSAARPVASGFPASADAPIWRFLKKVGDYDPSPYWLLVEQPVFVAFGEKDEQDNVPVKESVRRIELLFERSKKTNYDVVVVPNVGHALWNDERLFAPKLTERLTEWLAQYVHRQPGPANYFPVQNTDSQRQRK